MPGGVEMREQVAGPPGRGGLTRTRTKNKMKALVYTEMLMFVSGRAGAGGRCWLRVMVTVGEAMTTLEMVGRASWQQREGGLD